MPEELEEAQQFLGVVFPEDLKESYLRHNGQLDSLPTLFRFHELMSLVLVRDERDMLMEDVYGDWPEERASAPA